jgi:hypothetical protein
LAPERSRRINISGGRHVDPGREALTLNVAFEFVSVNEFKAGERKDPPCVSTVSSFDLKATAETLRTGLQSETSPPWVGVFYEPGAIIKDRLQAPRGGIEKDWDAAWKERVNAGRKVGEPNLTHSVWHNVAGNTKTEASRKPVSLHPVVTEELTQWRMRPSMRAGTLPLSRSAASRKAN